MKTITQIYDKMLDDNYTGLDKWVHHLVIFEDYLTKLKPKNSLTKFSLVNISESIDSSILFHNYLSQWNLEEFQIIHVHENPKDVSELKKLGIKTMQGSAEDESFLRKVASAAGSFDVLVDDTHYTNKQRTIVKFLYPRMADNGVLFVEDTYLGLRKEYVTSKPSFLEYVQTLYRELDDWHNNAMQDKQYQLPDQRRDIAEYRQLTQFAKNTKCIHLYNGLVVLERLSIEPPYQKVRHW